jgi:hypothetical protein
MNYLLIRTAQEAMMKGTIRTIDHGAGRIELTTAYGPVHVYFVPAMIKGLKAGDTVAVAVELDPISPDAGAAYERDKEERSTGATTDHRDMKTAQ